LLYHRRLDRVNPHPAGITGTVGIEQIAVGGASPGQQLSASQLGLATPSHPFRNEGALVLGYRTANLSQELIVRIITHGTFDERNLTAALSEFIDQEHLMHIVASEAIRSRDHEAFKGGHGGSVPQPIEARTVALGPAIAVIAREMFLGQMPLRLASHMRVQAHQLLLNRLLLLLTRR